MGGRVARVISQSNWMFLNEDPEFDYCYFAIVTDVYVFNGRVVSPVWTLESCDLETVSTRDG